MRHSRQVIFFAVLLVANGIPFVAKYMNDGGYNPLSVIGGIGSLGMILYLLPRLGYGRSLQRFDLAEFMHYKVLGSMKMVVEGCDDWYYVILQNTKGKIRVYRFSVTDYDEMVEASHPTEFTWINKQFMQ